MNGWDAGGHMAGMWLWWILGIVLVALVVWVVIRSMPGGTDDGAESPEEQLKRRYAQGEMDREEFNARLKDLRR